MRRIWPIIRLALGVLGVVGMGTALAQTNSLYVGVSEAVAHDSNLFRVASGQVESAETIATTSILAGADQMYGQQHVFADLAARRQQYRHNTQLNQVGYDGTAGLDWRAADNLSGKLSYVTHRSLAGFGSGAGPALTTKNEETSQDALASVRVGLAALVSLDAAVSHRTLDDSAIEFNFQDLRQTSVSVGLQYRPSDLLTSGIGVRHTRGSYPYALQPVLGSFVADDFSRNDIDLSASWVPSGLSTVRSRISYTKETHPQMAARDLKGVTGALRWEYQATGKVSLITDAARDTAAESAFYRMSTGGESLANSGAGLSNTLQLALAYQATPKIRIDGHARAVERNLLAVVDASGVTSTPAGVDHYGEIMLGLSYAPTRSVLTGCSGGQQRRYSATGASYPFRASLATCSLQIKTQ